MNNSVMENSWRKDVQRGITFELDPAAVQHEAFVLWIRLNPSLNIIRCCGYPKKNHRKKIKKMSKYLTTSMTLPLTQADLGLTACKQQMSTNFIPIMIFDIQFQGFT